MKLKVKKEIRGFPVQITGKNASLSKRRPCTKGQKEKKDEE
jgi:hypothetical protein